MSILWLLCAMSSAGSGGNIKALFIYISVAMVALGPAGCGFNSGDQAFEETVEQTYQVDPTVTLAISNADGSVRVYGADITEISVKAVKKALSAERLRKIDIKISAQHAAVSIETHYPPKKPWGFGDRSGTIDYILI